MLENHEKHIRSVEVKATEILNLGTRLQVHVPASLLLGKGPQLPTG